MKREWSIKDESVDSNSSLVDNFFDLGYNFILLIEVNKTLVHFDLETSSVKSTYLSFSLNVVCYVITYYLLV